MNSSYSYSQIWKIAYPIFLTLLVQNLIQVINTAFLGRVGEVELGASALAGIYYIVMFMLAFGFSTGSQILIGRRNGERNFDQIGEILVHGILFLLCIVLVLFFFTKAFAGEILSRLLSSPNVLKAAIDYLDWRIYGLFFSSVNVMFRAFYVGTTRTKILSLNALIMASVNIVLDYLLIFGNWGFPLLGIKGAALASVIAEATSLIFFIVYTLSFINLRKYGFSAIHLNSFHVLKNILNVSLSLMLQNFLSLATWFYFFLAIEHLGEKSLAITNISRSVYMIIAIPVFALASTANTLVSNTIGRGFQQDVIPLIWKVAKMSLAISGVFMLIIFLFPKLTLSIYTSDNSLIEAGVPSLMVLVAALPFISVGNVFFNSVSGTGNTRTALCIEIITLFMYVSYVWLIVTHLSVPLEICWTTEMVYGISIFTLSFIYLKKGNWQNRII